MAAGRQAPAADERGDPVFEAVKAHVEAAGGTLADVVKITTHVTDIRYRLDFRTVRDELLGQTGRRRRSSRSARSRIRTT